MLFFKITLNKIKEFNNFNSKKFLIIYKLNLFRKFNNNYKFKNRDKQNKIF